MSPTYYIWYKQNAVSLNGFSIFHHCLSFWETAFDDDDTDMFQQHMFVDSYLEYLPFKGECITYEMVKSFLYHFQKHLFDCSFKKSIPSTFLSPTRDCTSL